MKMQTAHIEEVIFSLQIPHQSIESFNYLYEDAFLSESRQACKKVHILRSGFFLTCQCKYPTALVK